MLLRDAVLERVEGEHGNARARAAEQAASGGKGVGQEVHLPVHRDPQGLERQSGGVMMTFPTPAYSLLDGADEVARRA